MTIAGRGFGASFMLCICAFTVGLWAQQDWSAGTWELNVAKSTSSGALPKAQTRTWEVSGQSVKYTLKGIDAQGRPMLTQYSAAYDGKDYPITGAEGSDTIALTRVDERTVRFTQKLAGRVVSTGTRVVAADGRTLTVSSSGTNAAGQPTRSTLVFERAVRLDLKPLEMILGTWTYEGTSPRTFRRPAGTWTGTERAEWLPGGQFVEMTRDGKGPSGAFRHRLMFGYHPAEKIHTFAWFDLTGGGTGMFTFTAAGNTWNVSGSGVTGDGGPFHERCSWVFASGGGSHARTCEESPDGKTWSPGFTGTYTKTP